MSRMICPSAGIGRFCDACLHAQPHEFTLPPDGNGPCDTPCPFYDVDTTGCKPVKDLRHFVELACQSK